MNNDFRIYSLFLNYLENPNYNIYKEFMKNLYELMEEKKQIEEKQSKEEDDKDVDYVQDKVQIVKEYLEKRVKESNNPIVQTNISNLLSELNKLDLNKKMYYCIILIHILTPQGWITPMLDIRGREVKDLEKLTEESVSGGYPLKYQRKYELDFATKG